MHANSAAAYASSHDTLSRREQDIHHVLLKHGAMTDREVMTKLGFVDPNTTRPRITQLIKSDWASECGEAIDSVTGKTVRKTMAHTEEQRQRIIENKQTYTQSNLI